MHTMDKHEITMDCFELDNYCGDLTIISGAGYVSNIDVEMNHHVRFLEQLRQRFKETKDRRYWKELIRWLPSGWLQKRTVTLTYENLLSMCSQDQRRPHKLTEWSQSFIDWARTLPYAQEFIFCDEMVDLPAMQHRINKVAKDLADLKSALQIADEDIQLDISPILKVLGLEEEKACE